MICISIGNPTVENCEALLRGWENQLAEIRLDGAKLSHEEIRYIFSFPPSLVATCRPTGDRTEAERRELLEVAIEAGAEFVDVEIESDDAFKQAVIRSARQNGCSVIVSYHNNKSTPGKDELEQIVERCFADGADIAKIACHVESHADAARILGIYAYKPEVLNEKAAPESPGARQILAIGMGEEGKITRVAAPLLGAPFTFSSVAPDQQTAPGQLGMEALESIYEIMEGH
jgi:3-dehydroquinate dehydratase type I